ncbi:MAG: pimeloyl-ACP methyl ester carboxylesterase [Paraglaciecola sp.]|jgi:pimeloyl-ACP methyl ester carboxylesterase
MGNSRIIPELTLNGLFEMKTAEQRSILPPINAPMVFFPGTLCDERVFMACWRELNLTQRAYVPLQWAENLEQMLALGEDRLGYFEQPVHLVGFSMGGYVAAHVALKNAPRVASLTLIGNYPGPLTEQECTARQQILRSINKGQYSAMSASRLKQFVHSSCDPEVLKTIKQMEADLGVSVLAHHISALTERQDLSEKLSKADFPLHILVGEQDQLASPDKLRQMCTTSPNSHFKQITGAGHMLPLEQPGAMAEYFVRHFA